MFLGRITVYTTVLFVLVFTGSASAVTITEFDPAPGKPSVPEQLVTGPDGNLWWAQNVVEPSIGRMSPTGEVLPAIEEHNGPVDLVAAPSGWVSWVSKHGYGTRSPQGTISRSLTELEGGAITLTAANEARYGGTDPNVARRICVPTIPSSDHIEGEGGCQNAKVGSKIEGLAASPGNTLWASMPGSDRVLIYTASPLNEQLSVDLPANSKPHGIAVGPEGDAWVAMWEAGAIDRITPTGTRTRFLLPAGSRPWDLVFGPDGAFWIIEAGTGKIARMTTAGLVTNEYAVPTEEGGQSGITVGPEGNIWFSDTEMGLIGRLIPDPLSPGGGGGAGGGAAGGGPSTAPPAATKDTVAPRFTVAPAFSPRRFRAAGQKSAPRGAGAPGSTLKFSLSEDASVTVAISLKASGRRAGKNCIAPAKAKPGAAKCTRYLAKGQLALNGKAGADNSSFNGKLNGKALVPGGYRASLTARDAAGNNSAAATANFTITR